MTKNPTFSSLQLKHAAFLEVSIAACEEGTFEGEASYSHELQSDLVEKERRLWRVELAVKLEHTPKKPFAYKGVVRAVGLIEAHADLPEDQMAEIMQVNGGAILYGVVREMVAMITSRSVNGLLMLPTLNFSSMLSTKAPASKVGAKAARRKKAAA